VLLSQRVLDRVVDRDVLHRHMLDLLDLLRQRDNLLLLLLLLLLQRGNTHVGEVMLLLLVVLLVLLLKLLLDLDLVLLLLLKLLVLHLLKLVLVNMHLLLLNLLLLLLLLLLKLLLLLLLLLNDQAVIRRGSFTSFLDGLSVGSIAVLVVFGRILTVYDVDHVLGVFRLLFTVSQMGQLSVVVSVVKCVLAIKANILILGDRKSAVDQGLLLVRELYHSIITRK